MRNLDHDLWSYHFQQRLLLNIDMGVPCQRYLQLNSSQYGVYLLLHMLAWSLFGQLISFQSRLQQITHYRACSFVVQNEYMLPEYFSVHLKMRGVCSISVNESGSEAVPTVYIVVKDALSLLFIRTIHTGSMKACQNLRNGQKYCYDCRQWNHTKRGTVRLQLRHHLSAFCVIPSILSHASAVQLTMLRQSAYAFQEPSLGRDFLHLLNFHIALLHASLLYLTLFVQSLEVYTVTD